MVGNQIPPNSMEAEVAVLGAMMLKKEAIGKAMEMLKPEHFHSDKHSIIFKAILDLFNNDVTVDIITLSQELKKRDKLEDIGGRRYLAYINKEVATSTNLEQYGLIVLEMVLRRVCIDGTGTVQNYMYDLSKDPLEGINILRSTYEEIESLVGFAPTVSEIELMEKVIDYKKKVISGEVKSIHFPIYRLNKELSFSRGEFMVIGGRPSMGKTAFALTLAEYWAKNGFKVLIFSAEMSAESLMTRRLSFYSGYTERELSTDLEKLNHAKELFQKNMNGNLFIDDRNDLSESNANGRLREWKRKEGIEIVFWDYIQLISDKKDVRLGVYNMSKLIKKSGKALDIWNVGLAQLNRDSTKGNKPSEMIPKFSQLGESGALEQDADVGILLHRPEVFFPEKEIKVYGEEVDPEGVAMILIEKQRNGKVGKVYSKFEKMNMKFTDWLTMDELQREYDRAI